MYALNSDARIPRLWILLAKVLVLVAVIVEKTQAFPIYPASKEWVCNPENVIYNATLQGGIRSGKFRKVGNIGNMDACTRFCCDDRNCDVAFMAKQNCYLVTCQNKYLCAPVATASPNLYPRLTYVSRTFFNAHTRTFPNQRTESAKGRGFGDVGDDNSPKSSNDDEIVSRNSLNNYDTATSMNLQNNLLKYDSIVHNFEQPKKKDRILKNMEAIPETNDSNEPTVKVYSKGCYPAKIHKGVSLRYGTHSGEFYDYGEIGDMRMCVDLCCKDKKCDVAFMVGKTCYTISCSSFDFCQMVPSSKQPNLSTQLAYVIKTKTEESKKKLLISQNHEKNIYRKITTQTNKKNRLLQATTPHLHSEELQSIEIGTPKSNIFSSEEPNIPKKFTKGCRNNRVLRNYGLIGGQRAGIYTLRGITPDFDSCIRLCCAEMMCDAALLLGRRCFSVQCFKNGACAGRPATTHGLRSKLAFVERKDEDIGEKRTSIPGLLPTDKQYTVYMNITSEDFKEGLRDYESLEFLNFAQALRTALNGILGNVEGFKYIEILKFKPNKVIAVFNITTDQKTHPKVLLQLIVDSLRKGELKAYDEPFAGKISLDVRGFQFYNNKGDNLVCSPEFNYDAHWPLAIFGTSVNIPCPRDASGLTNRKCKGSDDELGKWDVPDFSDCISQKYEDLFKEAQLLNSASVHSPELTPASIIDRLLQLTTADTYGSSPPSQRRHDNTQSNTRSQSHRHRFSQVGVTRESLHTPQIENLRKLVAEKFKEKAKFHSDNHHDVLRQKQQPAINLLPFFRGPTAKAIQPKPKTLQNAKQSNVKITSINITPNQNTGAGNPPSHHQSAPHLQAQTRLQLPPHLAPPAQYTQPQQRAPVTSNSLRKQESLQIPFAHSPQPLQNLQKQPSNPLNPSSTEIPNLRNLERAYSPDYRKFNGHQQVDPTLLLSEAHWTKPQKIQPKPRSAPLQTPVSNDYPGHVFRTISLPFQNSPPKSQPDWDYSRKLPVKNTAVETGRNLPPSTGNLASSLSKTLQSFQSPYVEPNKQLSNPTQLFTNPVVNQNDMYHRVAEPAFGVLQGSQTNMYKTNIEKQLGTLNKDNRKNYIVSIKKRSLGDVQYTDIDNISSKETPSNNTIDKGILTGYSNVKETLTHNVHVDDMPSKRDIEALGFDPKSIPKVVERRDVLSENNMVDSDREIQANILESLVSDNSDDDDVKQDDNVNHNSSNGVLTSEKPTKKLATSVSIVKSVDDNPTEYSVTDKKEIMKMLQENVRKMSAARMSTPEPFTLIEKASYRPNDGKNVIESKDDDADDIKKYEKPIIVDIPTTAKLAKNSKSPVLGNVHNTSKDQQDTSLDLTDDLLKINGQNPAPDPKETSSYTEAHVDNPPINAVASAKILHSDDVIGDGKTSSNIEITGIQGEPSSQSVSLPENQSSSEDGVLSSEKQSPDLPTQPANHNQEKVPLETQPVSVPDNKPSKNVANTPQPTPEVEMPSNAKGVGNQQVEEGNIQSQNTSETEAKPLTPNEKPETPSPRPETSNVPPDNKGEEDIPTVPLVDVTPAQNQIPVVANKPYNENETEIPQVVLKKLTVNETEENAAKSGSKSGESESMFTFEKEHGMNRSAMFGGDILLSADIIEELSNYMEKQTDAPSPQEVKEFFAAASALLDESNSHEWKNAQRHMKVLANEGEMATGDVDVQDWRSLHKFQSKRKPNILMELVDDIEVYGKAAARTITKYNHVFQRPIFTPNILTQFKVLIVEDLDDRPSANNVMSFPNFTNPMVAKWMTSSDQISLPAYLIAESIQSTSMVHISFFLFKTVYKLQRLQEDMDEDDDQEILDENPMKVGSELISLSVDPPLSDNLRIPVTINLEKSNYDAKAQHECAFWNATLNDWSTKGCKLVSFNDTHATCECNHLTTFGILVDSSKPQAPVPPDYGGISNKPPGESPSDATKPIETPPEKPPAPPQGLSPPKEPENPPSKKPSTEKPSESSSGNKNDILFWLLICLVILLIILLLCLCCLFCWLRRRKKEESTKAKEIVSSSGSGTSVGSAMLIDKSKLQPKRERPRSASPHPRESPGWLKLKSHADHSDEMLMKEKALLFSDYHQPYNFLTQEKERPNTSLESIYGGSDAPLPKPSSSSSSVPEENPHPSTSKRPDRGPSNQLFPKDRRPKAPSNFHPAEKSPPRDVRKKETPLQRANRNSGAGRNRDNTKAVPHEPKKNQETNSANMEWDPYYLNTKKNEDEKKKLEKKQNGTQKKPRNISPISEESSLGQETEAPIDSIAPQAGSEFESGPVSESIYPLSSSDQSEEGAQAQGKDSRKRSPPGGRPSLKTRNQTTQIGGKR